MNRPMGIPIAFSDELLRDKVDELVSERCSALIEEHATNRCTVICTRHSQMRVVLKMSTLRQIEQRFRT